MKRRFWIATSLAISLTLSIGGVALAQSPDQAPPASAAEETASPPIGVRGMQLFRDADSGQLRPPTEKEAASLAGQWSKMFDNRAIAPRVINYKNGMTSIEVPVTMLKFSAARVEADGSLAMECIQGPQRTLEFAQSTPTNGPAEE